MQIYLCMSYVGYGGNRRTLVVDCAARHKVPGHITWATDSRSQTVIINVL